MGLAWIKYRNSALPVAFAMASGVWNFAIARAEEIDGRFNIAELPNTATTRHFEIYSDLDTEQLEFHAQFFEGFASYFANGYFEAQQDRRLGIFLFKRSADYESFCVRHFGEIPSPYGFYLGSQEIAVFNRERGLGTATHELVHHFVNKGFERNCPVWVDEGFAMFFEKFLGHVDADGKLHISFGYFSNWRFPQTKDQISALTLDDLFEMRHKSAVRSFFLYLHRQGAMKGFVDAVRLGQYETPQIALERLLGSSLSEIEQDWKEWVGGQPIDANVNLVQSAFVLPQAQWDQWWRNAQKDIYWDETDKLFKAVETQ